MKLDEFEIDYASYWSNKLALTTLIGKVAKANVSLFSRLRFFLQELQAILEVFSNHTIHH